MTGFSLKDHLFNRAKVEYLAGLFATHDAAFEHRKFVGRVMRKLPALELKQRIVLIAETLEDFLPSHFPDAVTQILMSLPPPLDESKTDDDFGDFIFAPLGELVARKGLAVEHLLVSLNALKEITKRFSMEDATRAFIRRFPNETLAELTQWVNESNYHVRRLVSESTRPLLPWSGRIDLPAEATLPLLDALHGDNTRYVTRSVANHLNDIAKSNPELVVQTLANWHGQTRQTRDELQWMTRHSLRTLVKRGHAGSLRLLGFNPVPKLTVGELQIARTVLSRGETLEFSIEVLAHNDEAVVVDYAIDFAKAGGKRSTKVYKASKFNLRKGETRTIQKSHKLHANATTYRLHAGEHQLTIQINGQPTRTQSFTLT